MKKVYFPKSKKFVLEGIEEISREEENVFRIKIRGKPFVQIRRY